MKLSLSEVAPSLVDVLNCGWTAPHALRLISVKVLVKGTSEDLLLELS